MFVTFFTGDQTVQCALNEAEYARFRRRFRLLPHDRLAAGRRLLRSRDRCGVPRELSDDERGGSDR